VELIRVSFAFVTSEHNQTRDDVGFQHSARHALAWAGEKAFGLQDRPFVVGNAVHADKGVAVAGLGAAAKEGKFVFAEFGANHSLGARGRDACGILDLLPRGWQGSDTHVFLQE